MKREASSAKLLDKTVWNPRPVIDLLTRAVFESIPNRVFPSYCTFLGPAFSGRFTNGGRFMATVGTQRPSEHW
jgi:hypothetical protein